MRFSRFSLSLLALTLAMPAIAQYRPPYVASPYGPSPYAPSPTPDADALASEMRLLAANPMDLNALVRAGELALKLGDPTAAAALFTRAERIDPRNPRVKAGEASLLVQSERPGEALRRFAEAEMLGGDARAFAADRGLAYDLIGEQERAQRDYRLALRTGTNDETVRRYALSLGISGKRDLALGQLDPLLRRSDRGAWRARAFILAMGGDQNGATRIATSMMPAGMAQGLQPFFERLPMLSPADRAFAVHFGEVRTTPERLADARFTPALPALGPDPFAPVQVAAVRKAVPRIDAREERRKEKKRRRDARDWVELASATTPPPPVPLPGPPPYASPPRDLPVQMTSTIAPVPVPVRTMPVYPAAVRLPPATFVQRPTSSPAAVSVAATAATDPTKLPVTSPAATALVEMPVRPSVEANVRRSAVTKTPAIVALLPQTAAPVVVAAPVAASTAAPTAVATPEANAPPMAKVAVEAAARPLSPAVVTPTVSPTPASKTPVATVIPPEGQPAPAFVGPVTTAAATPATVASTPVAGPNPVRSEDSILASIIATIEVPGSELDVAPVEQPRPAPAPVLPPEGVLAAKPTPDTTFTDNRAAEEKALAEHKAADRKAAVDKKALADKKALDLKKAAGKKTAEVRKLADVKKAAEEKKRNDPKILEPSRIWVQVAGGANEADLPKQWAKLRDKAPAAFKGRQGWTTPLHATNRILAGPFKSGAEAQSFVNGLTREDMSGFVFTSDAGQKIARLPAK